MKETTNNRIDIVSSILETLKNKENIKNNVINGELGPIYAYFFKEDIMALFGRTEFDEDELDIITTREGLIIENIFTAPLNIYYINTQGGPKIAALLGNKEVFRIEYSNDTIVNRVMDESGVVTIYKVNVEENEYTFYQGAATDFYIDENELSYITKLTTFNAKIKEFETFELTRIKPEAEKSNSLLKRIIDNLTSDNYIRISTTSELVNTSIFSDRIFNRMKEIKAKDEAKKLKKCQ